MSGEVLLLQVANGLSFGVIFALIAAGITLMWGIMDFINMAHGDLYMLGAYGVQARSGREDRLARVLDLFPKLRERAGQVARTMSGGEQQMVAIGRALMSSPSLLLCDEISLGLAPTTIKDIYAALPSIRADGTAVILVEQDINQALSVADRFYCFQEGRISLSGKPGEVSKEQIKAAYFGLAEA